MVALILWQTDVPLPLPNGWQDLLLGGFGLTVYLLWDNVQLRRERNLLEAEAREMTKKALAALDALARKEGR